MAIIVIVGTLIIICLSAINIDDNKAAGHTLMLNVLFCFLGSIALVMLGNMYDAHLLHIKKKDFYTAILQKVNIVLER